MEEEQYRNDRRGEEEQAEFAEIKQNKWNEQKTEDNKSISQENIGWALGDCQVRETTNEHGSQAG